MEKKTLKKILVIAIVFVLTFSNCGFTLQALATSDGLGFFELNLFGHKELEFNAYFVDSNSEEQKSNIADVNDEMALVVELDPKIEGFLKTGTIKAIAEEGETNFEIKEVEVVTLEENTETEEKDEAEEKNETEDLTVVVAPEASLLQSEQIVNTLDNESQENTAVNNTTVDNTSVDNTTANENIVSEENVEENTVNVENTVSNDAVIENTVEENTVVEDVTEDENTVETPVEEEQLVDEEAVANEKFEQEKEEEKIEEIKNEAKATVVSGNEIEIENVIQPTKLYIKLQFKPGEKLNPADLYKQINLDLTGKYINVDLKEIEIALDETIEIGWTYSHEFEVSSTYTKVSPFDVVGTRGTIVENRIKVIRNIQDEKYLPIKQTKIEIEVPELHGKKPIEMEVSANKLKATRGEEINEVIFSKENWEYNEETNTLIIIVDNSDAVYTYGEDIYVITYRYEEYVQENEIDLEAKGKVTLEEYSGKENNVLSKDIHSEQKVVVNVGELITYSIGTTEEKINKSKINANYNSAEATYETEFTSTVNISVLTNDVLKEFKIKDTKEFYVDKQNLEFETQDVKYRKIKFKYEEIAELLQSGGIIEIKCNSGELLYTLNSELIKSQENCELDIKGEITGVEISFQNISVNGNITIDFVKAIGKSSFDKSAFSNFEKIESRIKAEVKYEVSEEATELPEIKTEKYFEDSFTKAEISISKEALSTINSNDDVEIKIELNNHLETSDLYVNPVFEIVFPKYVKNVEAKTTNLLYEDELKLKSTVVYKDGDVIKMQVALEGIQTKFSTGNLTNGTNIIINTNIQLDQYTPKKDDQLRMYYYNEAVTNYESQTKWTVNTGIPTGILKTTNGFDVEVISYQAPSGFVAVNEIENYDGQNSTVASIKQGEETRKVEREKQAQVATMKLVAMNNTGNHATDVLFLGRIPTQEATDVKTGESLGNNIDTAIVTAIVEDVNNPISADIYYSPNAKATKNLNDAANAWTDRPEDISQMKSFMIVPTGTVNAGTVFKYTYNFLIPENLPYEAKMYGSFGAYYNNHSEVAVTYETISADKVGLVTEAGPKVEAVLSVDIGDGTEIGEGRFLHYTLTVVNSGSMTAENITINNPVPENTTVYEETEIVGSGHYGWFAKSDIGESGLTWSIEKLEPGELQTYNYTVKTMKSPTMEQYYGREVKQDENGYYIEIVENVEIVEPENEIETNPNNETEPTRPKEETKKKYVEYFDMFTIKNKASVQVSNLAIDIESNEIKNKLKKSNFDMDIYSKMTNDVYVGGNFDLGIDIENITNETLNNVVFQYKLPKELVYKDFTGALSKQQLVIDDLGYTFDEATNIFTITIKQWLPEETLNMIISTQLLRANLNEIEHKIKLTKEDGTSEISHSADTWFKGPILEAIQVCSITDKIVEGENIEFITSVTNNGNAEAENTTIAAEISQNLTDVKVELTGAAKTTLVQNEGKVEYVQRFLDVGETVNIKISGKAIEVEDNNSVITNKMFVSHEYVDDVEINEINIQIENDPNKLPTEEEEEDDVQHIINNNSPKDEEDDVQHIINNNSPKDEEDNREEINNNNNNGNNGDDNGDNDNNDNGNNGGSNGNNNNGNDNSNNGNNENVNNNNGNSGNNDNGNNNSNNNNGNNNNNNPPKEEIKKYSISGKAWLDADKNGNMDANEEGIAGVQVQLQKDNIMVKATVTGKDGEYTFADLIPGKYIVIYNFDDELYTTTAYKATENRDDINSSAREISKGKAVTNNIFVTNSHIENVNLGLQNKDTFNFSISKYITSATVKTIKGETVHEYKNLELAKLEIAAKEIKGAIVELDYTIVVKNDGNVEGKAIQVVDYLAKDVVFDENDNIGWYLGKDGNAYNDTLKDVVIAPGATKELKISLTKNMTTENTGVLSNKVEVKTENEEGLKEEAKDNSSTQEIIISIKTGYIAQVTISIIVMAGTIGIIYLVVMKKVKIDLKKFRINRIYK